MNEKLNGGIGYTRLQTENEDTGEELPFRPHYRWTAEIRYYPVPRLMVNLNVEYTGESFNPFDFLIDLDGRPFSSKTASYKVVNLAAVYQLTRGNPLFGPLDFTLRLNNIFDEDYEVIPGFPNDGFTFIAGIRSSL